MQPRCILGIGGNWLGLNVERWTLNSLKVISASSHNTKFFAHLFSEWKRVCGHESITTDNIRFLFTEKEWQARTSRGCIYHGCLLYSHPGLRRSSSTSIAPFSPMYPDDSAIFNWSNSHLSLQPHSWLILIEHLLFNKTVDILSRFLKVISHASSFCRKLAELPRSSKINISSEKRR